MKSTGKRILSAAFFSATLLAAVSVAATLPFADAAYAKGGKDGGKGGDNGGNGNTADDSDAPGQSKSAKTEKSLSHKAEKSKGAGKVHALKKEKKTPKLHPHDHPAKLKKGADHGTVLGVHPSELGALNAAHASAKALAKANPNSRVGRIAAYRNAVLGRADLLSQYGVTRAALDGATPPVRDLVTITGELAQVDTDIGLTVGDLAAARAELAAAPVGTDTTVLTAEIAALETAVATLSTRRTAVQSELTATNDYVGLVDREADLRLAIANQPATELSLLEAAANKPVTARVIAAVNHLLGLEPVALIIPDAPVPPVILVPVIE